MLPQKYLQLYQDAITACAQIEGAMNRCPTVEQLIQLEGSPLPNLTDVVYACRETYELLDKLRKRVNGLHKEIQQAACVLYMQATPDEQFALSAAGCAVGEYASGKPGTKITVESLKRVKAPELYDRFCREVLGVTNETLIESGSIEVQYKYFGEWITDQISKGYVMPEVMSQLKTYNEHEFKVTKKRALLSPNEDKGRAAE